ncbi:uncharacterized protein [Drosophila kikkawai]|uniref:Uncharacterized protein n=1 Tax=Drosophila kikkawai TaxID=30033 RepID=A0A6P4IEZ0_DROKI|nr:uncharacterized protein LOC108074666 [Drosophila kikkawai]KAH8301764.1 hypothetical protein KR059_011258 [Drosophila kikkawai]
MPLLSKNLPMIRQMRTLAIKARLEQGQHTNSAILKAKSWCQDWPAREENYAAAQLQRQKQPIRTLSNRSPSQLDLGMFRPVSMPDQAYVPALPNRNTTVAAQNARRGRAVRADHMDRRMDMSDYRQEMMAADRVDEAEADPEAELSQQEHRMERRPEMRTDPDHDFESDLEVRSVREAVFGMPDDSEEDDRLRAQADTELLRRVAAQKVKEPPTPPISRKVIQPYASYRNHRTRWAEFRHSMIYGRSIF